MWLVATVLDDSGLTYIFHKTFTLGSGIEILYQTMYLDYCFCNPGFFNTCRKYKQFQSESVEGEKLEERE